MQRKELQVRRYFSVGNEAKTRCAQCKRVAAFFRGKFTFPKILFRQIPEIEARLSSRYDGLGFSIY